jgi:thioredoxin 1
MNYFVLFTVLIASLLFFSAEWGTSPTTTEPAIAFSDASWNEVMEKAKHENKIIFVDIYATWCGPCKLLKRTTFTDKEVGHYFNATFINVALDGEKGDGKILVRQYGVRGYPTLLFIKPDGSVKKQATGYQTASQLIRIAKEATL